jgi:hypothetical protein
LGQSGGDVLHVCQVNQKMDVVVQARGYREAGNVGGDAGKKKRKTLSSDIDSSFMIFGF